MTAYRSDIDGLRALAVLPVLLFHAGIPGVGGGYVGVDVFFVISGYLITGIIHREVSEGRFSIVRFYERRVRRLLSALFAVVLVTTIAAYKLLLPAQFLDYGQSLGAVALFSSNVLFFFEAGYFDAPAEVKPLLHTWSLSVEEQFYVFFPLLLLLVQRFLGRRFVLVVSLLCLVSFVANVALVGEHQSAAFYLLPFRAWELGIGSMLAIGAVPAIKNKNVAHACGAAGIVMILLAVFMFTSHTTFPGMAAALPCVGTALILHAGVLGQGVAFSILSREPLVFIGKISYSLYLWHWPIVVFTKQLAHGELTPALQAFICISSIALATLSWRFVEQPVRHPTKGPSRRTLFIAAGAATALWLGFGALVHKTRGLPQRLSPEAQAFAVAAEDFAPQPKNCPLFLNTPELCVLGAKDKPLSFLMWGDSHAGIFVNSVEEPAEKAGKAGLFSGVMSCPPLIGLSKDDNAVDDATDARCTTTNERVLEVLKAHDEIKNVLLVGRWAYYASGEGYGQESHATLELWRTGGQRTGRSDNRSVFEAAFAETLTTLTSMGKDVYVLEQVPELASYKASHLAMALVLNEDEALVRGMTEQARQSVDERQQSAAAVLAKFASNPKVHVLRTHDQFCNGDTCSALKDGVPRYFDNNHVTTATAIALQPVFAPVLR
jgi:peptidoglycan/LPS O-acetylase OafA/YrhL